MSLFVLLVLGGSAPTRNVYLILPDDTLWREISNDFLNGFYMAVSDSIPFIVLDEDTDQPFDTFLINFLQNNDPFIIVGPLKPQNTLLSADVCMRRRILNVLPVAYDVRLGTYGNYVYPFNYKYYAMVLKFASQLEDTSLVIFYEDNMFGRSVKELFDAMFSAPSFLLKKEYFKREEAKELIKDIRGFKYIFFANANLPSINAYLTLRKWGYRGKVYAFDTWLREDVVSLLIGMLENTYAFRLKEVSFSSYLMQMDRTRSFEEKYLKIYRKEPSKIARIGYDAGMLVAQVYSSCKDKECAKLKLLKYGIFHGVSGNYLISKDHETYIDLVPIAH